MNTRNSLIFWSILHLSTVPIFAFLPDLNRGIMQVDPEDVENSVYHNTMLGRCIDAYGPFVIYIVNPYFGKEKDMEFQVKIQSTGKAYIGSYLHHEHLSLKTLNDLRRSRRRYDWFLSGYIRHMNTIPKCAVLTVNNGEMQLVDGLSALVTIRPSEFMTEFTIEKLFSKGLNKDEIAIEFERVASSLAGGVMQVTSAGVISNTVHPNKMAYKIKPNTNRLGTLYIYHTDFSLSSTTDPNEPVQYFLKPLAHRVPGAFPIYMFEEIIGTLSLRSLKGYTRTAMDANISVVYSLLLLIDELPFYTPHIRYMMHGSDTANQVCGSIEMIRMHMTLVPHEDRGHFGNLFKHYRRNSRRNWILSNMEHVRFFLATLFANQPSVDNCIMV